MTVADTMKIVQLENEVNSLRQNVTGLRQIIHFAMCGDCGDQIGEEDFTLSEDDVLCHSRCVNQEGGMMGDE